jgi:Flp pilus assembly protein CpaB
MHKRIGHLIARLPRLGRRRQTRTIAMILVTVIAGGTTLRALNAASATQSIYGHRRMMTIADRDLEIGHVIDAADIERRELPVALFPDIPGDDQSGDTAGHAPDGPIDDPIGRTVVEPIYAGEVLVPQRLSSSPSVGLRGVVAETHRVVSVERGPLIPAVHPGDRVEVCAPGVGARASVLARRALIVGVDENSVSVAIGSNELPAVARAIIDGDVILALIGER